MAGSSDSDSMSRSARTCATWFLATMAFFIIDLSAKSSRVSTRRTSRTSPNAPLPMSATGSKSSRVSRRSLHASPPSDPLSIMSLWFRLRSTASLDSASFANSGDVSSASTRGSGGGGGVSAGGSSPAASSSSICAISKSRSAALSWRWSGCAGGVSMPAGRGPTASTRCLRRCVDVS